jgi:hypothetical protein
MAGWLTALSQAVYREYDRRIRRASLVTEYGAAHYSHTGAPHGEDEGDVEIANVPRGAPVADHASVSEPAAPEPLHVDDTGERQPHSPQEAPPRDPVPPPGASTASQEAGDDGEAEIVNAPPGTSVKP